MVKRRILLITDDMSICRAIQGSMENDCTDVYYTGSSTEALDTFIKQEHCLVIADFQLLGTDGLDMFRIMREVRHTPILAITPHLNSDGKVALFQAGVNAFIEKPVDITVCVAQSTTLIELYSNLDNKAGNSCPLIFGTELVISPLYRQVIIDGTQVDLTRTEFDLLFFLAQHPGRVWSRSQLYHYVWPDTLGLDGNQTVKTHVGNLKKKLTNLGKNYIQNSRGVGYKFVPPL